MKTGQESEFNVFLVVVSISLLDKFIKLPGIGESMKFHSSDFWDKIIGEDGPSDSGLIYLCYCSVLHWNAIL